MKRFLYVITMIYYAFAWHGMFFSILPFEANISAGVVGLLAVADTPKNVELSNLIYIMGWSVYFITLIICTTISHFWKKGFNTIPIIILSISLFFNVLLFIHSMFLPILINTALIVITVYIRRIEITPEQIENEKAENNSHKFITEVLSKEA